MRTLLILLCVVIGLPMLKAQSSQPPIVFIYDASGSMWGQQEGKTKMAIASRVLGATVDNLPQQQQMGLVAYGHRRKGDCEDVEYLVSSDNGKSADIKAALKDITPLGRTPLAYSASLVIEQLKSSGQKATIILITDGIESCNGNLCSVVKEAKEAGIDFRLHIIGFGLKEAETEQLRCAAQAGDGNYYDASDASALGDGLAEATSSTVDKPVSNFTAFATKNGEPVDALVRAYHSTAKQKPILARTYGDTAKVYLPPGTYNLEVTALANSDIQPILVEGITTSDEGIEHQTVSFDGGVIRVTTTNNDEGWDTMYKVFDTRSGEQVAQGRTYGGSKGAEVNPGVYSVQFNALKIKGNAIEYRLEDITVTAGETTDVAHNFSSGMAMIGISKGGELVDATVSIKDGASGSSVAAGRTYTSPNNNPRKFILSPGTYNVTYNTLGKHKGTKNTFSITVKTGETVEKLIQL